MSHNEKVSIQEGKELIPSKFLFATKNFDMNRDSGEYFPQTPTVNWRSYNSILESNSKIFSGVYRDLCEEKESDQVIWRNTYFWLKRKFLKSDAFKFISLVSNFYRK
jgi:hypothetical protein